MWHVLTHYPQKFLVISSHPHYIVCGILHQQQQTMPLTLNAYTHISFDALEYEQGILFNPTRIGFLVNTFIHEYQLETIPIIWGIAHPTLHEQIVRKGTAHPCDPDFQLPNHTHMQWHYTYLYPYSQGHVFYVCGIPQHIIFQHQLLALKHHWNLITLSPEYLAPLYVYRFAKGTEFRPAQLSCDMEAQYNIPDALITHDMIHSIVTLHIDQFDIQKHINQLITLCGLFLGEHYTYEAH